MLSFHSPHKITFIEDVYFPMTYYSTKSHEPNNSEAPTATMLVLLIAGNYTYECEMVR
jgi:hypothetical protein